MEDGLWGQSSADGAEPRERQVTGGLIAALCEGYIYGSRLNMNQTEHLISFANGFGNSSMTHLLQG